MPDYLREVSEFRVPILERVPRGSAVLDVGAWTGAHGNWLAERRDATVDGIELEPEAAAEATRYRSMIVGSVEDPVVRGRLAPGSYDVVLFLDVLEHLARPDAVLEAAHTWLRPGGTVLCSIPNVAHWRVRVSLLRGRFDYENVGLFDRTHLRWYTRSTARDLVTGAGFRITWEDATVPQHPRVKVPQPLLRPELFAYQFQYEGTRD
jgi:2-polyprenyl-3-methyl-5-hydroxy-6-metoxy-1,4-benzoquinol methylase